MEDVMLYAGDTMKELEEAEKLSVKSEGIISLTVRCGGSRTLICC